MFKDGLSLTFASFLALSGLAVAGCDESGGAGSDTSATDDHGHDHSHDDHEHTDDEVATADEAGWPEQPEIGLAVGTPAPDAAMLDANGNDVSLASVYADGPTVVVFYRGGWCPYCTKSLAVWQGELDALKAAGGRLVAISPEKPDETLNTAEAHSLGFTILSDATFAAADAYNLRFSLTDETVEAYRGYGIALDEHNATPEWDLPHPGTFVIDSEGVIRWASASEDYSTRPDPAEVIAFVESL